MPNEDLTTYTEIDPLGQLTETSARVTFANTIAAIQGLYSDKGAVFFNATFRHNFDFKVTADENKANGFYVLCNNIENAQLLFQNNHDAFVFDAYGVSPNNPELYEYVTGAGPFSDTYSSGGSSLTYNTTYFVQIYYDSAFGSFGKLWCYIYPTDADRTAGTNVTTTMSLVLHKAASFRYIYAYSSYGTNSYAGYAENFNLSASAPPVGPANLKSLDGNLKANIKSISGNLIANVKSFDGNS